MDSILFGHNTETKVASVYQAGETSVRIAKHVDGKTVTEERKSYPFFFLSDESLLAGFGKKFWKVALAGNNYYRYLCIFRRWGDLRAALRVIADNIGTRTGTYVKDTSDVEEVYVKLDPVFQFLMQTGMTLFKEMDFTELKRMQLDIETFSQSGFSNAARPQDRIIIISLSDNTGWEYAIEGRSKTEGEMLSELVNIIKARDPDVIEGHNIYNFDLPYIMRRCEMNGVKLRIGRDSLEPKMFSSRLSYAEKEIEYTNIEIPGRHIIDTWLLVQNYDSQRREMESYGLKNVAKFFGFASRERVYVEGSKISETWLKDPDLLIRYSLDDVRETRMIADHLSQASFHLTQMLPFNYGLIPRSGSASKIEALFVREYLRKKHSIPRPQSGRQTSGGYTDVFIRGVEGPVIHADVESLYPSIMLAYKISPATDELGIFQKTLRHLTKLRLETKKQMREEADPVKKSKLDAMQSSLKILINSFYGYLGYSRGIFNDYMAADRVTETGQRILRQLISEIAGDGGKLLEVDTDGLYFVPPPDYLGEENEKKYVNKLSRSLEPGINLSLDGRYEKMLSYKKKNYALLGYDGRIKMRGSALISRSMERFGRAFIEESIEHLLKEEIEELHKLYIEFTRRILSRELPIREMVRTETVRDTIEEYLTSVKSGKRNRSASYEAALNAGLQLKAGDRVSYYITGSEGATRSFTNSRLYDPDDPDLPDYNAQYYLRKLDEYAERFSEFFKPEDFTKVFSSDEGSLFTTSLEGVEIITKEVTEAETRGEEEDSD